MSAGSAIFVTSPLLVAQLRQHPPPKLGLWPTIFRPWHKPLCEHCPLAHKSAGPAKTAARGSNGEWEEPVDGYGSEFDEDEAEFTAAVSDEENLLKEVGLLLTPEEKSIFDEHATPDLSKISTPKWHVLHSFALSLQIHLMDRLLENGMDIDSVDRDGFTALHKAVVGKKEAVISHLLRKGANPHFQDRDGATPLHYAVQLGALQTVKLLIKYKVDVNVEDNDGWTPLHLAIQSRNRDIAKVLLVNGADKTRRTKGGITALDLSICYGKDFKSYDLAKLLKLVPAASPHI